MKYTRKYFLQCSHFNNGRTYVKYHDALVSQDFGLLHHILEKEVHGHNFEVTVAVDAAVEDPEWLVTDTTDQYIIEDEQLTELVMSLDNCNLSIHPMFLGFNVTGFPFPLENHPRVTAELMCTTLCDEVSHLVRLYDGKSRFSVTVSVRETRDIEASHSKQFTSLRKEG